MYLPARFIDDPREEPLAGQADFLLQTHRLAQEKVIPLVPDGFRPELSQMAVIVCPHVDEKARSVGGSYNFLSNVIVAQIPRRAPRDHSEERFIQGDYLDTMGHEVCHGLRGRFCRLARLVDAVVHEGLAMHFGRAAKGDSIDPEEYEDTDLTAQMLQDVRHDLLCAGYSYDEWFRRSSDGYAIGERFVGLYLADNRLPVGQVLNLPSHVFVNHAENHVAHRENCRNIIRDILKYG